MAPQSDGRRDNMRREREGKSVASSIRHYIRSFTAFMFSNVGVIGLVVGYIIAGAFIFTYIEESSATERANSMRRIRETTAAGLWRQAAFTLNGFDEDKWTKAIGAELINYQHQVVAAVRSGWDGSDGDHSRWTFSGSFLYSLTVITTIGYGNISPKTDLGKVVTICYAMFGMPLFLLYLTNIGDIFARAFKWWYVRACLCRSCPGLEKRRYLTALYKQMLENAYLEDVSSIEEYSLRRIVNGDIQASTGLQRQDSGATDINSWHSSFESSVRIDDPIPKLMDTQNITVPHSVCVLIMVGYIIFGAMLFRLWEDWNAIDGAYFCFISLTSIGFGDIVPGDRIYAAKPMDASFIVCSLYLLLGMALIAMCFNLMQMLENAYLEDVSSIEEYSLRRIVNGDIQASTGLQRQDSGATDINSWHSSFESSVRIDDPIPKLMDTQNITVPHSVCVLIMVGYIIFGAMLFRLWEDWNAIDGAYFCFISLTSIGFGDIVPGDRIYAAKPMDASFIVCSLYLLLGMALIAMCFNLMQEQVMQQISNAKATLKRMFRCGS